MKKVIGGLRYDTEKAIEVGTHYHGNHPGSGNFSHWFATLYKTPRSGKFFLHGEGGPMTQFATCNAHGISSGEDIIPLSAAEALRWAEQFLKADDIEEHFSDSIQDA